MAKKVAVNIRECKLIDQAFAKNSFRYLTLDEQKTLDKIYKAMKESEVFTKVGGEIQAEGERLVREECIPEWNRISEEMRPLGKERNVLDKEKAADKENFPKEKEERLEELNKKLWELTSEYNSVTDKANAKLSVFKEEKINSNKKACFFLSEEDYQFIGELCWFALPTKKE